MGKIIFIVFLFFTSFVFSQTEKEELELDNILNELFNIEELSIETKKLSYLYYTLSYSDKAYFAGRDFGVNQYGISPSLSYMSSNNFFVSIGSTYYSELNPQWDLISLSTGFSKSLGKEEKLSLTGIFSRSFFLSNTSDLNPNRISTSISLTEKNLKIRGSGGYLFGGSSTFYASADTEYKIKLIEGQKLTLDFCPEVTLLFSKQTISEEISFSSFNSIINATDVFDLINTQFSFPFEVDYGNWDFQLIYSINAPKAIGNETDISQNGFLSFAIGYLVGL
jgi:hypothetical protein